MSAGVNVRITRLEELYRRKLVHPDHARRRFPLQYALTHELEYFPARPEIPNYDILEIGPGTGDFLMHTAVCHPQKQIAGIEIGGARFVRIRERLLRRDIHNVTLIHGDARVALHKDLRASHFEKIFVLFPDPWPKTRHAHQRLLSRDFLAMLSPTLKPGGHFTLVTDVHDYAAWVQDNLTAFPVLQISSPSGEFSLSSPELIPTFFAKKWRQMGRSVYTVHAVCGG